MVDQGASVNARELRMTTPLVGNWKFVQDDTLAADWQPISLPHAWNAAAPYRRGIGWYRLTFETPTTGARHWLEFGAASIVADVWLNGRKLGRHRGAFTAFRFDVTDKLIANGGNVLLVKVDNRAPTTDSDVTAIAPLSGDFNMSGGLYRHVALISTPDPVHIALDDMGGPGVYAATTGISDSSATVNVRSKLKSDSGHDADYTIRAALLANNGRLAGMAQKNVSLAAGARLEVPLELIVDNARLWQGLDDPYQYQLVVELLATDGTPLDKVVQHFGIRQMRFDANKGFFLNGRNIRLHGVAMHQDYPGKGWGITDEDIDESLALIRDIGANTVRLAHYPHNLRTLEVASRLGLVVWAEVPFVNGVSTVRCSGTDATDAFKANVKQQLRELIRQQYNQAAIAMWSVGNEIAMMSTGCPAAPYDNVTPLLRELHALAKAEDASRVTTEADLGEELAAMGRSIATGGITDVWALNRYCLWYYGNSVSELGALLDTLHDKYPDQPMGISEYGAGAALSHHSDNPLGGPAEVFNTGQPVVYQTEEYANYVHEQHYRMITEKRYLWGSYVWNMFDFGSAMRNEGDIRGVNTKGLVTFDRRTKKDAFYFYKANWSSDPVTYITGRRYTHRAYAVADVKIYSNADSVQLSVNGKVIGSTSKAQCPMSICLFKDVRLSPGINELTALGDHGGKFVSDSVQWSLHTRDVNIAAGQLTTGFTASDGALFGSDHFFTGGRGDWLIARALAASDDKTPPRVTPDPHLFSNFRRGTFSYDIPLDNGDYSVTLGFLEPDSHAAVGDRVFTVAVNGRPRLSHFDILKAAGAYRAAVVRTFPATVFEGRLRLAFMPNKGEAIVSNIRIRKLQSP